MSKFEEESKVITVKMKCDKCGKGFMESVGISYHTSPMQYQHKCTNCGYKENYFTKYPYQKFVPKEPEEQKILKVKMTCEKCGKKTMKFKDLLLPFDQPAMVIFKCTDCGHEDTYRTIYPGAKCVPIEPEEPHVEPSKGKVYISGQISGLEKSDYMNRFADAEKDLSERGYIVVNPAKVLAQLPEETKHGEYMKLSLVMLDMCDSIYMLNGYQKSNGARLEHQYAMSMGKKTMYQEDELFRGLANGVNKNG